jgi:two-component system LytT family response regulator
MTKPPQLKALIIDDEKDAVIGLRTMLQDFCEGVEVVGEAYSAIEGLKLIRHFNPDLIFLDVEMPGGNGFDMLEALQDRSVRVVFTTAYDNYSIRALRADADDYLLKPLDIDDLQNAVEKVRRIVGKTRPRDHSLSPEEYRLRLNSQKGIVFVSCSEVVHIEGDGRYSTVYTSAGEQYVVTRNLGEFEEELTRFRFFRVHKSHLINCRHVERISHADGGFVELSNGQSIEISRRKKAEFIHLMES